jgi:hypothetical protein
MKPQQENFIQNLQINLSSLFQEISRYSFIERQRDIPGSLKEKDFNYNDIL